MTRVLAIATTLLAACGGGPEPHVGSWVRVTSVATDFDFDGAPIEWCTLSTQALDLNEDGSYALVDAQEPDPNASCDAPPDPVVISTSGQYRRADYDENGAYVLLFTQDLEIVDAVKNSDDSESGAIVDWSSGVAWSEDDEGRWLLLDAIGTFRAVDSE